MEKKIIRLPEEYSENLVKSKRKAFSKLHKEISGLFGKNEKTKQEIESLLINSGLVKNNVESLELFNILSNNAILVEKGSFNIMHWDYIFFLERISGEERYKSKFGTYYNPSFEGYFLKN
ncbi:MAG: hypothetical protein WC812_04125 [Candidatus Pacearchaeota archaeon]|jgi:hypothetical protein